MMASTEGTNQTNRHAQDVRCFTPVRLNTAPPDLSILERALLSCIVRQINCSQDQDDESSGSQATMRH